MKALIKRPALITTACIFGITGSLISFVFVFSPFVRKIGDWAPAIYGIIIALRFISFIGVWNMKKWGVLLFVTSFMADIVFSLLAYEVNYFGVFFYLLFTIFFLIYYRKMDDEL